MQETKINDNVKLELIKASDIVPREVQCRNGNYQYRNYIRIKRQGCFENGAAFAEHIINSKKVILSKAAIHWCLLQNYKYLYII